MLSQGYSAGWNAKWEGQTSVGSASGECSGSCPGWEMSGGNVWGELFSGEKFGELSWWGMSEEMFGETVREGTLRRMSGSPCRNKSLYQSLCVAAMICGSLLHIHTDTQTRQLLTGYTVSSAI